MLTAPVADKHFELKRRPKDFENNLFFAARNLAIEALILRIESLMLRAGFMATVYWIEQHATTLEIRILNPKPTAAGWQHVTATIYLFRERIPVYSNDEISECFYSLRRVAPPVPWQTKEPRHVQAFRTLLDQLMANDYFKHEIAKLNYPFDRSYFSGY